MEYLNVGFISGFHGVKGEMKIKSVTDFENERFKVGSKLLMFFNNDIIEVEIVSQRVHKNVNLVKFKGYDNLNDVEKFKGSALKVTLDNKIDLSLDEYYHYELMNCTVFSFDNVKLGLVYKIMDNNANDILLIKTDDKDILVPFLKQFVNKVDIDKKEIYLEDIEGLF